LEIQTFSELNALPGDLQLKVVLWRIKLIGSERQDICSSQHFMWWVAKWRVHLLTGCGVSTFLLIGPTLTM